MGKTGNTSGLHLHFEIRTRQNKYDVTMDPAIYMKIPNKVGIYNSRNYEVNLINYEVGSTVYLECKFTGATNGNTSLIQVKDMQFWVYNSGLSKDKTKLRAIVCYEEDTRIMIDIDSLLDRNRQFWVNKSEVL